MALPSTKELIEKDLFELLGIQDSSDEYKSQLLESMSKTVDARVINRLSDMLSEEDSKKFEELAEDGDSQAIVKLFVDKGIDLPSIVFEEAIKHRAEIVSAISLVKEIYNKKTNR